MACQDRVTIKADAPAITSLPTLDSGVDSTTVTDNVIVSRRRPLRRILLKPHCRKDRPPCGFGCVACRGRRRLRSLPASHTGHDSTIHEALKIEIAGKIC